jgi:hypothetical protein
MYAAVEMNIPKDQGHVPHGRDTDVSEQETARMTKNVAYGTFLV